VGRRGPALRSGHGQGEQRHQDDGDHADESTSHVASVRPVDEDCQAQ
jgi:hypothetical protein